MQFKLYQHPYKTRKRIVFLISIRTHYYNYITITTGNEVCRGEILESYNVTKSFVPNLTPNKLDTIKDDQELSDAPKVAKHDSYTCS